ncbi:MAG: DUF4924 family protein [Prevotellaceae bacterium]|jgi:hypothetical protein|nr:DUF4924 family protein [Prevotellaceae bacterium]
MLVAKIKRNENIAEYVLYLWQIEDLLRAMNFDGNVIYRTLVEPLKVSDEKKQETFFWYMGIVNLLKEDGKDTVGHNRHSLSVIAELNKLHLDLLKTDSKYSALFEAARDDIDLFREKLSKTANHVEIAFDALYAKLLLNMKKERISAETSAAFDRIAAMLARLSAKFHEENAEK